MRRWVLVVAAVVVLAIIGLSGLGSATDFCYYAGDGEGVYTVSSDTAPAIIRYHGSCNAFSVDWYGYVAGGGEFKIFRRSDSGTCQCGFNLRPWWETHYGSAHGTFPIYGTPSVNIGLEIASSSGYPSSFTIIVRNASTNKYTASGTTDCVSDTSLWIHNGTDYVPLTSTSTSPYSFGILDGYSYRLLFDGAYYDFTCTGNEVFDYDACIFVYGYTCGIDSIRLYVDDGGSWVVDEIESQFGGYANYEIPITDGKSYLISFVDCGFVIHNQTFTCTGDHVLIDYDRCEYIDYSVPVNPYVPPIIIYLWAGYDYNIVVCRDESGNLIENSQLAIYDKTDDQYLQKWTDTSDGYALLGARFDTDHDVLLTLRTFDGVFALDTEYPANGSALVGEEEITTTNWTIPIWYNVDIYPVDQADIPLLDVFCGLSEYTPLNPQAFWGMDWGSRGYVAVGGCSGFSMCDLVAEKAGYEDYNVTALNWTSRSALVKDYRHTATLIKE